MKPYHICPQCAKEGKKVYMKLVRKSLTLTEYRCPECKKILIKNKTV